MKKYNVYDLSVVEVLSSNNIYYLICKYSRLSETYIEIFTKEKIEVADNSVVESLANYYPILARRDYITGKPLMLDKKELLEKFIHINSAYNLKKGLTLFETAGNDIKTANALPKIEKDDVKIDDILEKATLNFFPKEGVWYSDCFERSKDLTMRNLPCNLSDDLWLAKMLKVNQKLLSISTDRILQFVHTSSFFQEKKHEYELEIVKWQIDWMVNGGDNWLVDKNYGGDFIFLSSMCDLGFRKGVVDTLSNIGISIDTIEEGIEKNAFKWRDTFMNKAFSNEYEPKFFNQDLFNPQLTLEQVDLEFKEKWLKVRKYEYYQRHKDSVDKYGVVEPDMKLSAEEVEELKIYLMQKHNERMLQIEQFEQAQKEVLEKSKTLKRN